MQARTTSKQSCPDGSSFVACPICGRSVALLLVNDHLDGCSGSLNSKRPRSRCSDVQVEPPSSNHSLGEADRPRPRKSRISCSTAGLQPGGHLEDLKSLGLQEDFADKHHATPQPVSQPAAKPLKPASKPPSKLAALRPNAEVTGSARLKTAACGSHHLSLTLIELEDAAPVSIIENVLPSALASTLLGELNEAGPHWVRGSWYLFGKQHAAPRTSAFFTLPHAEVNLMTAILDYRQRRSCATGAAGTVDSSACSFLNSCWALFYMRGLCPGSSARLSPG